MYFVNSQCLVCNRPLGFLEDEQVLSSCEINEQGKWIASYNGKAYKPCNNYSQTNICNWLIPEDSHQSLCESCLLTETIPDLCKQENLMLWFRMEQAKRHLIYTLKKLELPIVGKHQEPNGLSFRFLEDEVESVYGRELTVKNSITTGHSNGVITINLKEAEDAKRVAIRELLNERYRTLIGHFRHEAGHYYWDCLIRNSQHLQEFRELFGDERQDYQACLERYYEKGPAEDWYYHCISAYASMHPWEDWAETWAHYLHIVDTLEAAHEFQIILENSKLKNPLIAHHPNTSNFNESSFSTLLDDWDKLTSLLNALNRSMGLDDAYPFTINPPTRKKLHFIHMIVRER